jgi:hypothetical protein
MLKKLILATAALTLAAPAFADGRDHRGGHGNGHGHNKHHWKHHHRPVVVMPPPRVVYYAPPPRVYYAPPAPVYYSPPPAVYYPAPAYPEPSVSFRIRIPL